MRFDAKFARALERRYINKFINTSRSNLNKFLNVTFWFTHDYKEFMFKYEYSSKLNDEGSFTIKGALYLYSQGGNHTSISRESPWAFINPDILARKYDFNWDHPKLKIAKRCMEKDVQQTEKEIERYENQIERVWRVCPTSI